MEKSIASVANDETPIKKMIYGIRNKQVMLDSDLAKLYGVETKRINEAIRRNKDKFPERFCFRITSQEYNSLRIQTQEMDEPLRSQNATLKNGRGQHRKYTPYVFTEQGVAMLATVLKSNTATKVSIGIMDAFVSMKKYVSDNLLEQRYINNIVLEDHDRIKQLENSFQLLHEKEKTNEIFFDGQVYDAYSKIWEIFNEAKEELIVIDNYADNTLLNIIKKFKTKTTIITKYDNLLSRQDISKYRQQYNNLEVVYNKCFHDRYFILDGRKVYHCGASINRIGYKTFSMTLLTDREICKMLIEKVASILQRN